MMTVVVMILVFVMVTELTIVMVSSKVTFGMVTEFKSTMYAEVYVEYCGNSKLKV